MSGAEWQEAIRIIEVQLEDLAIAFEHMSDELEGATQEVGSLGDELHVAHNDIRLLERELEEAQEEQHD